MNSEIQRWVDKAEEDWLSAKWLLEEESPVTTPALFHLQQCVEKLLKGNLVKDSVRFERKHDLGYLLHLSENPHFDAYADLLDELNPFAVELRYPGDLPIFSKKEAREILAKVQDFREVLLTEIYQ